MRFSYIYYIGIGIALWATGCVDDPEMEGGLKNAKKPVVETLDIVRSDATSVTIQGEVVKENGAPVTEAGFCWGTGSDFAFASGQAQKAAERKGKYEAHIEGLQANQDYYIRAYAINAVDTAFGETLSFHTADGLGGVKTLQSKRIYSTKAECGGLITKAGEAEVEQRGIYLMTQPKPSASDSLILIPMQADSFYCTISGLQPLTTYYVRAYAANKFGAYSGAQVESFTTTDGLPLLKQEDFKRVEVSYHYADFQLTITDEGDSPVTQRGFCLSKTESPTIEQGDTVLCGTGIGTFVGRIAKMEQQQEYYVRGFVTNEQGTRYTDGVGIQTLLMCALPTLTTTEVESAQMKEGIVTVGGEILDAGATAISEAGVCWSTTAKVTLQNMQGHLTTQTTSGRFSESLKGLRGGTRYYLRAYATNKDGTAYGEEISFVTPNILTTMASFKGGYRVAGTPAFTVLNNVGILLGGDAGASYSDQLWAYGAPSRNDWTQLRQQPKALSGQTLFSKGFGLWAFGGIDSEGKVSDDLFFYSAPFNEWSVKEEDLESRPKGIYRAANCVHEDKAYLIGGKTAEKSLTNSCWAFDINANQWTACTSFPIAQYGGIAVSIDGQLYAGLGVVSNDLTTASYSKRLWRSGDGAATWEEETPFPGEGLLGGVAIDKTIYGVDTSGHIWSYDTQTKQWSQRSQLPDTYRTFHCIYVLYNKVFIGLGTGVDSLIKYDPLWDN